MDNLRFYDGSTWKEMPVSGDISIGRQPGNTLQLQDPQVSSQHALIQTRPDGVCITDLGSTNGTLVNGVYLAPQTPTFLLPGQEIRVGNCVLQLIQTASSPMSPGVPVVTSAPGFSGVPGFSGAAQPPVQKKKFPLIPVLLGGGVMVLCCGIIAAVLIVGGFLALPGSSNTVTSSQPSNSSSGAAETLPPPLALTKQVDTSVAGDGQPVKDGSDVAVTVPDGSIHGADRVTMTTSLPPDSFDKNLEKSGLTRKSSLYSLKVDGEGENLGGAELSFPSSGPDDRLAVLLDQRFLAVLGVLPQDGRLVVTANVFPGGSPGPIEGGGTAYFVISGATSSQNNQWPSTAPAAGSFALSQRYDTLLFSAWEPFNRPGVMPQVQRVKNCQNYTDTMSCWNDDHSIIYTSDVTTKAFTIEISVPQMLDSATRIANLYGTGVNGLGIIRIPTTSDPLYIVRDDTTVDPLYSSWSKKIYLESDDVVNMNQTVMQQMLAHEMFHWVENKTYIMFMKGGDTAYTWDMETRAETATFLIDPSFQTAELLKRGAAFHSDQNQILGWQEAGKDWATDSINLQVVGDPDRYVHGFMVRMGLCTGNEACKDTRAGFATDINTGTRILFGSGENYPATLPNTAKYLLGFAPENAVYEDPGVNFAASELQTGRGYGDYIHVSKNYSEYVTIFSPVNLEKNKDTGVATLHAKIGKLGIYPLRVSNGADKPIEDPAYQGPRLEPNVPYSLTINKGVRFFYRVGTELIERDGTEDTTISPISSEANVSIQDESGKIVTTPGIPVVRLVAINDTEGDLTLTGTLMPIEPLIKVDPLTINLNNKGSTETTIQVNLSQIFLNIKSFKIVIDYGDGDLPVIIDAKPDADGKVDISDKHRFLIANRDVKAVTLSFKDKDGKSLGWPDYVIPVQGGVDVSRPKFNQIGVEIIFGNTNYNPHYSYLNQTIDFKSGTFTTTPNDFIHGSVTADYKAITVILNVNDHKIELNDIPKINLDDLNKTYTYGVCTVAAILPHVLLDGATPNWTPEEGANGRECVMIYLAEIK